MRTIQLKMWSGSHHDSAFQAVNDERCEYAATLEFFVVHCDCGASGMYVAEVFHDKSTAWQSAVSPIPDIAPAYETVLVNCPGDCGAPPQYIPLGNVHPYHGSKLRLLESWRRDVRVDGLDESNRHDRPHRHTYTTTSDTAIRGHLETYKHPTKLTTQLRITIDIDESMLKVNSTLDPRDAIMHKLEDLIFHPTLRSWLP